MFVMFKEINYQSPVSKTRKNPINLDLLLIN